MPDHVFLNAFTDENHNIFCRVFLDIVSAGSFRFCMVITFIVNLEHFDFLSSVGDLGVHFKVKFVSKRCN